AILGTTLSGVAQNCTAAPSAQTFSNRVEFASNYYYALGNYLFDLTTQTPITISSMKTWNYDQGIGNPPVPNQVGATGMVKVYTCPTTRVGNETNAPTNPGSPWTLLGTGTVVVALQPAESVITFAPPLSLPVPGSYGVAMEWVPTTSGPNPGPLHCLGVSPNPGTPYTDQFLTMSNDGIQQTSWAGTGQDSPNLRITYLPAANSAIYTQLGEGCYFDPHAFYESFPESPAMPDIANTGQLWLNLGPNYLIVPGAGVIVPPTSTSLTVNPPAASSSGNWDDALSAPIMLPFTFNYPGGSTNMITISSNGSVYLAAVSSSTYQTCGASYGGIVPFRDEPARIAAYYHDLDPSVSGGIYYDVDPSMSIVRITFDHIQEWGVAAAVNTMQVTLDASGQVEIAYGGLSNQSAGNNAIAGFTNGYGARLAAPVDLSARINAPMGFTTGDGRFPPVLKMDARPVLGTSPNIVTTNVTPGTLIQALAAGDVALPGPLDLGFIGMPGCNLHINVQILFTNIINGSGQFVQPFVIPNTAMLQGQQLVFQAAPLTPGYNSLGLLTSNGLCTRLGQ
ncbi:MAG TPA: hypothetical protein VFZ65_10150, partial [Planctomycetota bacterium]|nr:hypothetical protein [Planctomycetota bacterium]